jgi:hypothetical protein
MCGPSLNLFRRSATNVARLRYASQDGANHTLSKLKKTASRWLFSMQRVAEYFNLSYKPGLLLAALQRKAALAVGLGAGPYDRVSRPENKCGSRPTGMSRATKGDYLWSSKGVLVRAWTGGRVAPLSRLGVLRISRPFATKSSRGKHVFCRFERCPMGTSKNPVIPA